MKKIFYISDLDGTLLNFSGVLSDYTRQAVEKFNQHNVPFSLATGRSYGSMRHVMDKSLDVDLPVITFGGALISSFRSPKPIFLKEIDSQVAREVVRFIQRESFNVFLDILNRDRTEFLFEDYQNEASRVFVESWKQPQVYSNVRHVPLISPYAKQTVISLVVVDSTERITALKERAEKEFAGAPIRFDQESSVRFKFHQADILWIMPDQAHKETAIREFCSMRNIKLEEVTFFGDNTNDLSVFQMEKVRKIAVANAIEPIRALADVVIGTNDEDSVIGYIEADHERGLVDL